MDLNIPLKIGASSFMFTLERSLSEEASTLTKLHKLISKLYIPLLLTLADGGFELGFFGSSSSLSQVRSTQDSSAFAAVGFALIFGKSSVIISEKEKIILFSCFLFEKVEVSYPSHLKSPPPSECSSWACRGWLSVCLSVLTTNHPVEVEFHCRRRQVSLMQSLPGNTRR